MKVFEDQVEFPNGHKGIYGVVEKHHFVVVIPYQDGMFSMVKQYRYPINRFSLEFPQGNHEDDADIDPVELAKAELLEETGLRAGQMEYLGFYYQGPGFCRQGFNVYLAKELSEGSQQLEKTEEGLEVKRFTLAELEEMVLKGEIIDSATLTAIAILKIKKII
jgi:8-oxo-dGTP pyrophosphatase MutT (NUDIX family)